MHGWSAKACSGLRNAAVPAPQELGLTPRLGGDVQTVPLAEVEHVTVRPKKPYKLIGALIGIPFDIAITVVLLLTVDVSGSDWGS